MSRNTYRILDANLNRAREALRVLEDYVRFQHSDEALTYTFKKLRHHLAQLAQPLHQKLLTARDSVADIGPAIERKSKSAKRKSVDDVFTVNARRLQEALRSIEEYAKIVALPLSLQAQKLRFEVYTLEKKLTGLFDKRTKLERVRLYVLLPAMLIARQVAVVEHILNGGADILQLRGEGIDDRQLFRLAEMLRRKTEKRAMLIINNRIDVTEAVEADGVHLGKDDLPIAKACELLGTAKIIGATSHNLHETLTAERAGADYISVGPMFPSLTKPELEADGFRYLKGALQKVRIPIFCVGGITLGNVRHVLHGGISRVAVCHAIVDAPNILKATKELKRVLEK